LRTSQSGISVQARKNRVANGMFSQNHDVADSLVLGYATDL